MRITPPLPVDVSDVPVLRGWIETDGRGRTAARRARIVLLSGQGLGPSAIATELGCSKQTVITWRERYRHAGLAGLVDAPRSGRPVTVDAAAVVARTLEPPSNPALARWSTRTLAAELGISNVAVAGVWRAWGITPTGPAGVRLATEPPLDSTVTALAGLYLHPPVTLLALLVGAPGPGGEPVPVRQRPDPGTRFAVPDPVGDVGGPAAPGPDPGGGARLGEFLDRLDEVLTADGARVALLVAGGAVAQARLRDRIAARPNVALHVVPPTLPWARVARVACLLAGSSQAGAASVARLIGELDAGHHCWIPAADVRANFAHAGTSLQWVPDKCPDAVSPGISGSFRQ